MKKHVGRGILSALVSLALLAGMVPVAAAGTEDAGTAPGWAEELLDPGEKITVLVELEGAPAVELSTYGARGAEDYKAELMEAQADLMETAQAEVELEVGYQYNTIFNGFSCEISAGDMDTLAQMEGVKGVYPVRYYAAPEAVQGEPIATPQMAQSGEVTGNAQMTTDGFGGQGMVVAILDSGINLEHPAYTVYDNMLGEVALDQATVTAKIAATAEDGGTAGRGMYVSEKIPFACNYTDLEHSQNLTHGNGHGTHVAGIAAGYERDDQGNAVFSGSAPGAQILGMQIFGDTGGTSSAVYIKALEDAFNLGADVVNMSLGVPRGFSNTGAENDPEEAIYARMADAGVLVCISAGNSASYFQNWDASHPDYATVGSPSTYGSNISVSSVDNLGSGASTDNVTRFSRSFSSVGPATTLDMRPVLTSVGGAVSSANAAFTPGDEKSKYVVEWGTSMSCPNLVGTFAALLDYLRGTKGLDKETAGKTALKLMESAAVPVLGGNDRYATVLQQGAGLGNSATAQAAYEHGAYLDNPIQELRDDPDKTGEYSMTLTLTNATASAVTYTPGAVVMTDEVIDGVNTQNSAYLYKAGETIDPAKAEVTFSQESVTVPANGTASVTATVTLTEAGKTYMNDTFPNGGYIDGFITFTPPQGSDAPEVHATYLAFYGDWGAVPALAPFAPLQEPLPAFPKDASPNVVPQSEIKLGYCDFKASGRPWHDDYLLLGENPMNGWNATAESEGDTAPYNVKHAAFPGGYKTDTGVSDTLYNTLVVAPTVLRNVERFTFAVTAADGTASYRVNESRLSKSGFDSKTKSWNQASFTWDAYNDYSQANSQNNIPNTLWLKDGTVAKVTLTAKTPYTRPGSTTSEAQPPLQFTLTVDQTAPTLAASEAVYDPAENTLTISATDSQYVAAVFLVDGEGNTVDCDLFSEEDPNTAVTAVLDVSGHAEGDVIKVRTMDYASNWAETEVTLSTAPAPVDPDPVTVTFDVNGGVQPTSHEDYSQTVAVGEAPARPAADPARTDYTFLGWAASADGAVLDTLPVTVENTNVTYYAQWEAVTPTVSVALRYDETSKTITATPTVNLSQYNITYTWTENGAPAPGATQGSVYTVPQDAQPGDHVYTCVAAVTHPGDPAKTASSEPVTWTVNIPQPVDPGEDKPGPGEDKPDPGEDKPDPVEDKPDPGEDKPDPGEDKPTPGGNVGGGAAPSSLKTTEKRKNADGSTVAVATTPTGDKTFTVTNAAGDQVAQVSIPAQIDPIPESQRFADVPAEHWADQSIHRMASLGLFKGVDAQGKLFDMASPMTRGALTEVLYRLSNGAPETVTYSFFDVELDAWYTQAVIWATKHGVVNGTGAGTFQPQRPITRQELATVLYRYAQLLGAADAPQTDGLDVFLDSALVDTWAAPGVAWCVQEGILQGRWYGVLYPTAEVTRAEAATMLDRLLQVLK